MVSYNILLFKHKMIKHIFIFFVCTLIYLILIKIKYFSPQTNILDLRSRHWLFIQKKVFTYDYFCGFFCLFIYLFNAWIIKKVKLIHRGGDCGSSQTWSPHFDTWHRVFHFENKKNVYFYKLLIRIKYVFIIFNTNLVKSS